MLFLLALAALVLYQVRRDVRIMERLRPTGLARSPIKRAGLLFVLLLAVPFIFVQQSPFGGVLRSSGELVLGASVFIAFLISYTWYRYLTWLDRFEREQFLWELLVFIAACASTFHTFPLTDIVVGALDLRLDGDHVNDWWYSVIGIGLVEESVKLLPLVLLMLFTKQADEPFDLILYASICALGFAFVENTLYLLRTDLVAVGGRVLYASVAHMFFCSIVAYSMAMARHRGRSLVLFGALGLVLASVAHGFYNYWLLSPGRPHILTMLFFLGSIHLWVAMKNNLINLSPHYQVEMRPQPTMFRYRIINALLAIFGFTYVVKFLTEGIGPADALLEAQGGNMGAMLLYLAISFSSFRFVPGYIAPLQPKGVPWRFLFPVLHWGDDLTGRRLLLRIPEKRSDARHYMALHTMLPLEGLFTQRVFMEDDQDWYLFRPDKPIPFDGAEGNALLIRPHQVNDTIPDDRYVVVVVMAFHRTPVITDARVQRQQVEFAGFVHGKLL